MNIPALECEHGHPQPARCALCRRREERLRHPERYPAAEQLRPGRRGVPRPVWFDAEVQRARETRNTR